VDSCSVCGTRPMELCTGPERCVAVPGGRSGCRRSPSAGRSGFGRWHPSSPGRGVEVLCPVEAAVRPPQVDQLVRSRGIVQVRSGDLAAAPGVVGARGDLNFMPAEHTADRLDPEAILVGVNVGDDQEGRRSSSAAANNADAVFTIWLARRSSEFSLRTRTSRRSHRWSPPDAHRPGPRPGRPSPAAAPGGCRTALRSAPGSTSPTRCYGPADAPDTAGWPGAGSAGRTYVVQAGLHPCGIRASDGSGAVQAAGTHSSPPSPLSSDLVLLGPPASGSCDKFQAAAPSRAPTT